MSGTAERFGDLSTLARGRGEAEVGAGAPGTSGFWSSRGAVRGAFFRCEILYYDHPGGLFSAEGAEGTVAAS
jgi:hypothetical protein